MKMKSIYNFFVGMMLVVLCGNSFKIQTAAMEPAAEFIEPSSTEPAAATALARPNRYIILTDFKKADIIREVIYQNERKFNEALNLNIAGATDIQYVKNANQIPTLLPKVNAIIIATGSYMQPLFQLINNYSDGKKIHSIILIDPKVTTPSIWHPFGDPIKIHYSKISNSIYNFYSEAAGGFTRKIGSWLDKTNTGKFFLKGRNIKCQYVDEYGAEQTVDFNPDSPNVDNFGRFIKNFLDVILEINTHYPIESDFITTLLSDNELKLSNDACPIIKLNPGKEVKIEKNVLKTNLAGSTYEDASNQLSPAEEEIIKEKQKEAIIYSTTIDPFQQKVRRLGLWERRVKPTTYASWEAQAKAFKDILLKMAPPGESAAIVRIGSNQMGVEQGYLANRRPIVAQYLKLDPSGFVPQVAVAASGGGVRAMLATLGILQGLVETGLINVVTYMCGLSGSTWAIGPWISSGLDIHAFSQLMVNQLETGKMVNPGDLKSYYQQGRLTLAQLLAMSDAYYYKKEYDLPASVVDIYGRYLINYLLPDPYKFVYLSQQVDRVNDGSKPLPIYTAVRADGKTKDAISKENKWYEFTPYEVGAQWLGKEGMYIPSWALGRAFENGKSIDFSPEQPLGLHMAIFGSAFALSIGRLYEEISKSTGWLRYAAIPLYPFDPNRQLVAGAFKNFTRNLQASQLKDQPIMQMVDAGLAFNLPYPPVSGQNGGRKADVVIFVDASDDREQPGSELRNTERYAISQGLQFPNLDTDEIDMSTLNFLGPDKFENRIITPVRMFMSPVNTHAPLVIYIRFARSPDDDKVDANFVRDCMQGSCGTFNFAYPKPTADNVIMMMKNNIIKNKDNIEKAIYHLWRCINEPEFYKQWSASVLPHGEIKSELIESYRREEEGH